MDVNYTGNRLNKNIKKDNFKKDLNILIETNHQININVFYMNVNLQLKIRKTRKYIDQAFEHLRMIATNLKTINLTTSNLKKTKGFLLE